MLEYIPEEYHEAFISALVIQYILFVVAIIVSAATEGDADAFKTKARFIISLIPIIGLVLNIFVFILFILKMVYEFYTDLE